MSEIRTGFVTTVNQTRIAIRGSAYTEQSSNGQRSLSSTSVQDVAGGTGVKSVLITYYDQDVNGPYTELVAMNGTTPVNTVATNICFIEKMEAEETASSGLSAGSIRIHTAIAGGGSIFAQINSIDTRTRYCHHYIAAGKTMNIKMLTASCITSDFLFDGIVRKYSQPVGTIFYALAPICSSIHVDPTSPPSQVWFEDPVQIMGPAKIELFAKSNAALGGGTIHADFSFYET